jgi:hypothetical protein
MMATVSFSETSASWPILTKLGDSYSEAWLQALVSGFVVDKVVL